MFATLLMVIGGMLVLTIIGALLGASLDTSAQQRAHRRAAEERQRLSAERHQLREEYRHRGSDPCPSCGFIYGWER